MKCLSQSDTDLVIGFPHALWEPVLSFVGGGMIVDETELLTVLKLLSSAQKGGGIARTAEVRDTIEEVFETANDLLRTLQYLQLTTRKDYITW